MRSWYVEKGGERGAQKLNARGEMRGRKSLLDAKRRGLQYYEAGFYTSFAIINAYCAVVQCMSFMLQSNLPEMCALRRT